MVEVYRRDSLGRRIWWAPPNSGTRNAHTDLALDDPEQPEHFRMAWEGREPADALTSHDRRLLVARRWEMGWRDTDIARHTRMTLQTTSRIRQELGLAPR